jgi:hypothetical protein
MCDDDWYKPHPDRPAPPRLSRRRHREAPRLGAKVSRGNLGAYVTLRDVSRSVDKRVALQSTIDRCRLRNH